MIAVSNTTPLRYLIAIDQASVLGQLFEKVVIPPAVRQELTDSRTPESVRRWILSAPRWLEIHESAVAETNFSLMLHRGEREAIQLAESIGSDFLLIDEQAGRSVALSRNLPVLGTLGVLERADTTGMLSDFPSVIDQLVASGFFVTSKLRENLLKRHLARKPKA